MIYFILCRQTIRTLHISLTSYKDNYETISRAFVKKKLTTAHINANSNLGQLFYCSFLVPHTDEATNERSKPTVMQYCGKWYYYQDKDRARGVASGRVLAQHTEACSVALIAKQPILERATEKKANIHLNKHHLFLQMQS